MPCSVINRCENFRQNPLPGKERECIILCNRNPKAMSIVMMEDWFSEKGGDEDDKGTVLDPEDFIEYEEIGSEDGREKMNKQFFDDVKGVDDMFIESEEQQFDFDTSEDGDNSVLKKSMQSLQKKVSSKSIGDEDIREASKPVDLDSRREYTFEDAVAEVEDVTMIPETDRKKPNPIDYEPTGDVGRPSMTDAEKEASANRRAKEKEIAEREKQKEAEERKERRIKERKLQLLEQKTKKELIEFLEENGINEMDMRYNKDNILKRAKEVLNKD